MTRVFLSIVAGIVGLVIVGAILLAIFWDEAQEAALSHMKPAVTFADAPLPPAPDYTQPAAWAMRPDNVREAGLLPEKVDAVAPLEVDIFYLHPTTYLETAYWNAPIDYQGGNALLTRALKTQAGAFAATGRIFAPRYRQASFGSFLVGNENTSKALAVAYGDVKAAFDHYMSQENEGRPFILVGHSQGSLHGLHLLADRIASTELAERFIAAYLPGWPIAPDADLAALAGIEPCISPETLHCVASWHSFTEGGDPSSFVAASAGQAGLSGEPKQASDILCVNPVSWRMTTETAPQSAHKGAVAPTLMPDAPLSEPLPRLVSARCGEDGFLSMRPAPEGPFTTFLLPGGNYHVYDIHLFYMDIRANARARAEAFLARNRR